MKSLYKVIGELQEKGFEESQIGFHFVKAVSEMNSKEGKYISRYHPSDDSSDAKRNHVIKAMKRNFIKGLMAYFTHSETDIPEISLDGINAQPVRMDLNHSIEEPLFNMVCDRFAGSPETVDDFCAGIGRKVIAAESEYSKMHGNKTADHVKEYNLLLKHIIG